MFGAVAAHAAGHDLAALVYEAAKTVHIFVVDVFDLVHAEAAHLAARLASTGTRPSFTTILRHGFNLLWSHHQGSGALAPP